MGIPLLKKYSGFRDGDITPVNQARGPMRFQRSYAHGAGPRGRLLLELGFFFLTNKKARGLIITMIFSL